MSRYARQMLLPEVGAEGQARLAGAHVLVVGAGGLGCAALPYLAGAGLGRITILDPDRVSESNLHRQTLFREVDVDQPKARVARDVLRAMNGEIAVEGRVEALTPANASALVGPATLVLDCADMFAVSYTLSDACLEAGTPLVSASVLGMSGYCGGFCGTAPSLRAVFPDLPAQAASCDTAGVLGPMVGMLGAAQAQMALGVLLGLEPSPLGQVVTMDGLTCRMGGFRFDAAPEPATGWRFIAPEDVTPEDFAVDLRGAEEAPLFHPSAHRHPPEAVPTPDTERAILACRTGLRAWRAATDLAARWDGEIALIAMGDT
ncbi:HesA/MoeB/ThiF family protein [Pseudaestuariivita atlantica]|nr:HesA/MoeB/ThiF family protein [Pseudaestuariivita atlantica]